LLFHCLIFQARVCHFREKLKPLDNKFKSNQHIFSSFSFKTKRDLEKLVDEINAGRPQCPVGLNTLVIPRKVTLGEHVNQPYVYLNCGHVQGELAKFKDAKALWLFHFSPIGLAGPPKAQKVASPSKEIIFN
jgi:hypothetical protein